MVFQSDFLGAILPMVCIHWKEGWRELPDTVLYMQGHKKDRNQVLSTQVKSKLILLHNNVNVLNATELYT